MRRGGAFDAGVVLKRKCRNSSAAISRGESPPARESAVEKAGAISRTPKSGAVRPDERLEGNHPQGPFMPGLTTRLSQAVLRNASDAERHKYLRIALQWRHLSTGIVASISDRRIVGARHGVPLRRRSETAATARCPSIYVSPQKKAGAVRDPPLDPIRAGPKGSSRPFLPPAPRLSTSGPLASYSSISWLLILSSKKRLHKEQGGIRAKSH
jgi:hypothetical protein